MRHRDIAPYQNLYCLSKSEIFLKEDLHLTEISIVSSHLRCVLKDQALNLCQFLKMHSRTHKAEGLIVICYSLGSTHT